MHGLFAVPATQFGPTSLQIAHGHNHFLYADLSEHTTATVERLISDATGPLLATFLAAKATPAAKFIKSNADAIAANRM